METEDCGIVLYFPYNNGGDIFAKNKEVRFNVLKKSQNEAQMGFNVLSPI